MADDTIFTFSSLYWIAGFALLIGGTLHSATRLITTKTFTPELMLRLLEQYRVSLAISTTFYMAQIVECPLVETTNLSAFKRYFVGGMAVPEQLRQRMQKYLPHGRVITSYGMSEAGGIVTGNLSDNHPSSVGQLGCGMRLRILNESGELCGPNEDGEISMWFDPPFRGYYNDEAATDAFKDADGWIQSGDVGRFDDDGHLYFVDRLKDIIMYDCRLSPTEIEKVVLSAQGVATACVVGISVNGVNEWPTALVIRNGRDAVTEKEICDLVEGGNY